jgi:hypothetical protein
MLFLISNTIFYKIIIRKKFNSFNEFSVFGEVIMQRRGTTNLPLHGGHTPRWLFDRMTKLSGAITEVVVEEYGTPAEVFHSPKSEKTRAFLCAGKEI